MRLLRLTVLLVAFAVAVRAQPVAVAPDSLGVPELLAQFKVPAASVALIRDFKIEWARAWGVKDAGTSEAATVDTLFQAASISKPVAAMASLRAVQDGRFALDQDINTILKSWRLPARPSSSGEIVTPRMLMSHTSGTDDGFGFPGYTPDAPRPSVVQILDGQPPSNRGAVRLGRPPMTGYKYSGGAVTIQELALTDVIGKPFAAIMREMVLAPIGMTNSTYDQPLPADWQSRAAHAHGPDGRPGTRRGASIRNTPPRDSGRRHLISRSLRSKFSRRWQGDRLKFSRERRPRKWSRRSASGLTRSDSASPKMGEGWYFSHGGSNVGFRCDLIAHRSKGYGVVIMTNGDNGGQLIAALRDKISRAAAWDIHDKPIPR